MGETVSGETHPVRKANGCSPKKEGTYSVVSMATGFFKIGTQEIKVQQPNLQTKGRRHYNEKHKKGDI